MVLVGLSIGWILSINISTNSAIGLKFTLHHYARCIMWYLVPLSTQFILKFPLTSAHQYIKTVDQGWFEIMSGQGSFLTSTTQSNLAVILSPKQPTTYLSISVVILTTLITTIYITHL
jgi:hypothetical protein